jgi:serine/threonine-protein kinase
MSLTGLAQGYAFAGRYRVLRCLAAGGMGAVYEVVHVETERRRALKVMLPELVNNLELRDRFQREARVCANVSSEFIVEVVDAGVDQATAMPFLVMELLDGEELGKRLQRLGRLTPADVVAYLRQVGSALDKTHAAGIVHRDLKPENLFLTLRDDGSPRLKILDFGISKIVKEGTARANATQTLGTPLYMAPEQIAAMPVSPATDLYSLALIAYTLLVGVPYWQDEADRADNVLAFAMLTCNGPSEGAAARAARRGVTLGAAFDAWFRRATAREPSQRFARASELVLALAEALGASLPHSASLPPAAVEPATSRGVVPAASVPLEPWSASSIPSRRRTPVVALSLGGLTLAAAAVAGYLRLRAPEQPAGELAASSSSPPSAASATSAPATTVAPPERPDAAAAPTVVVTPLTAPSSEPPAAATTASATSSKRAPRVKTTHPSPAKTAERPEPAKRAIPAEKAQPLYTRD